MAAALAAGTAPAQAGSVWVVDGDTIRLNDEPIRLEGIDAPETDQQCNDAIGKVFACGRVATTMLRRLIGNAAVTCTPDGHDAYGRTLGHCVAGKVELNERMVAMGYARAFVKYSAEYLAPEARAKAAHAGLWAGSWQAPWEWRADRLAPTGKCIIKGNISHGQRIYYMPFHVGYARVKIDEAKGERWFCTEGEAMGAGWQRALR